MTPNTASIITEAITVFRDDIAEPIRTALRAMALPYLLFRHEILEIVERDTPISRAMAALSCPSARRRSASWR